LSDNGCVVENRAVAYRPALPGGAVSHGEHVVATLEDLNSMLALLGEGGWKVVSTSSVSDGGVLVFLTRETPSDNRRPTA
jgi:hypothetical protein